MGKIRLRLLVTVTVGVFLILSACSNSSDTSSDSNSNSNNKTLEVWQLGSGKWKKIVGPYEEKTGIDVQIQGIPWKNGHQKLLTAVASGKGPDIILMGTTWMKEFAKAGAFVDLSKYIDNYSNLAPENFVDGSLKTSTFNGKTYGIPWHVDTRVLFYRTDILADVGYPNGPKTWNDLIDASKKLAARGKNQYAIDLPLTDINMIYSIAWQHGWEYEPEKGADNFLKPGFKKMVKLYEKFYESGYSQVKEGKEVFQSFSDGSKPMFMSGPWMIQTLKKRAPKIKGKWALHVMPKAKTNLSMIGGSQITIFKGTDKVKMALDFINWMSRVETQIEWYKVRNELPSLKKAWKKPIIANNEKVSVFGKQLQSVEAPPTMPGNTAIASEIKDMLEKVIRANKDVGQALKDLHATVKEILNEHS